MKIGILGCGYIGKALAHHYKKKHIQIAVTTRQTEKLAELHYFTPNVYLLRQMKNYLDFLKDLTHLIILVAPDSPHDYSRTYLGVTRLIASLIPQAPCLQQIIYTSSTSVYGEHEGQWVDENSPCQPLNENGAILLQAENQLLQVMSEQLTITIFRLGEIIGPGRLIEDRLKNSPQKIYPGTGEQYSNLVHLDDIIQATDLVIQHKVGGVYNLCNDFHLSRKTLYEEICQKCHLQSIQWDKELSNPHGGNKRISNQKIKNLGMNFQPFEYKVL